MDCLSENTVQQILDGTLVEVRVREAHGHLDTCRSCRELLSTLAAALSAPAAQSADEAGPEGPGSAADPESPLPHALAPGTEIGRFIVQSPLGTGGMGVVHAALDPVLGRKVALKLIHADHSEGLASEEWRARLLREARAIARLSHPNVITVHEIGLHGDQPFVAMELVEGSTLRSWLAASPRSWRDVVSVFVAAGRGLLAAHLAGLVHRDFKPDNVLIGHDGRIRVTDFGLACPLPDMDGDGGDGPAPEAGEETLRALGSSVRDREGHLTRTGALVGTPGYIAPEVLRGGAADFASDQFSFCVALHEALFRERPSPRASPRSGEHPSGAVTAVERRPQTRVRGDHHAVPGWLQQTVQRGLSPRPADRFPSMETLLLALNREPVRRRRLQLGVAAAMVVATGVGAGIVAAGDRDPEICTGAREQVSAVWNPGVAARVQSSFAATGRPHARTSADRVAEGVTTYTARWATMHRAACLATARSEQSPDLLDRRLSCLGRRLDHVAALVNLFVRHADGNMVDRAIDMAGKLEPLSACADSAALLSRVALPADPSRRARVAELERQLDRAELERQAGRPQAAADAARAVLHAQAHLDHAPLAAQAEGVLGRSLEDLGRIAEAREVLGRAQRMAQRAGDARLAVDFMLELLFVVGARQEHHGEAQLLADVVEGALESPELRGDEALRARWLTTLGTIAARQKRDDRALELQREVLAIRRRTLPAISEEVASAEERVGNALTAKSLQDEARRHHFEALAIRRQLFGDHHPDVAATHSNLAVAYLQEARPDEARPHLLAARAILEAIPEHRSYHHVLGNLGELERMVGDHERARRYHEEALAVRKRQLGPEHRYVAISLGSIGDVLRAMGDLRQALSYHRRALAVLEKSIPLDHPDRATGLSDIGEDLRRLGHAAESLRYQERALAILQARSPDVDSIAVLHQGLALLDLGRRREATSVLTRAYDLTSAGGLHRAEAAFGLARALDPRRPRSQRARQLAEEALTIFTDVRAERERAAAAAYVGRPAR